MENKIMPCPRCGGMGIVERESGSYGYTPPTVYIKCVACWFKTPPEPTEEYDWKKSKHINTEIKARDRVIVEWNRRVSGRE